MLNFQPAGFGQKTVQTTLGAIAYYTPTRKPWTVDDTLLPLIFLHSFGGGASAYEWSKVYPAFANTHRIIAPDLIGWGQSHHPSRNYQVDDYLLTIAEFIQQVASVPVVAVASSLTAGLMVRLAAQKPELLQSLYLVCPSGFADFGEGAERRLPLEIIRTPWLDRAIYALGATHELAVRNFLEQFLFARPDRITNEIVAAYLTSAQKPNAEYAALAFLRGDLYFDLSLYLPQLTVPTGIVWGERSRFTNVNLGRRLAQLNSTAIQRFQIVPDTGILPHLEQPGVVTGLLADWLRQKQ
ncbi:MAG: alpha/beta hydrolase [Cyanothece sp. SIO1E1]|nr:alpha/beta hydrolase [Cyanothece sp. SIO1E1]